MLTMFLGQVVTLVITEWRGMTGGTSGLLNIPHLGTIPVLGRFSISFSTRLPNLYFVLILMIVILLFLYGIDRSYIGKTFKAIAQDDSLAASAGINVARYRVPLTLGAIGLAIVTAGLTLTRGLFWVASASADFVSSSSANASSRSVLSADSDLPWAPSVPACFVAWRRPSGPRSAEYSPTPLSDSRSHA